MKAGRRTFTIILGLILLGAGIVLATIMSRRAAPDDSAGHQVSRQAIQPMSGLASSRVDYRKLEQRIALLMQQPDMVGLAVGTIENGQIAFLKGYGETVAGSGDRVTPETVFRWASLSKGVGSALIVKLAEEGKFSLDAPLSGMATTLTLPGDWRAVTVADLLSHRLGLVRNAWDERLEAGEDPRVLRAMLGTLPPFCPPATCYAYQNIAYDAATEIVQRVTSEDYGTAAQTMLFAPLGMTHASVGRAGLESAASWARPYRHNHAPGAVNDAYYRIPAAGGVNSSIFDLTLWMRAQLGEVPGVLSPQVLAAMHRARVSTPPHGRRGPMDQALKNASYGLGWRSFNYEGHALVGHRGAVDGYGSLILFDPADKSGIVMLWNANSSMPARLQLEFFDLLYQRPFTDWLQLPPPGKGATGNPATDATP